MVEVKSKPGENIDSLLRRFKKAVENSGILADYRKNEAYEKPSVKRKRKKAAAIKRARKAEKNRRPKSSKVSWQWNNDRTKKIPMRPRAKTFNNKSNNNNYNNKNESAFNKPYRSSTKPKYQKRPK